ncbi:hypothetical protein Tco_1346142 [Tanacetum coccineum]
MVSTRNNSITPVPIMESMQESIDELKSAVLEIKEGMKTFLVGHKKLSDEVEKDKLHLIRDAFFAISVEFGFSEQNCKVVQISIMPPRRRLKKVSVKRLVERRVAKAIEEYEKAVRTLNFSEWKGIIPLTGTEGVVGLRRFGLEKVEQVFETWQSVPKKTRLCCWASTFDGRALTSMEMGNVNVPVIVDLRDEYQAVSLEQVMSPIMQEFWEIETCVEYLKADAYIDGDWLHDLNIVDRRSGEIIEPMVDRDSVNNKSLDNEDESGAVVLIAVESNQNYLGVQKNPPALALCPATDKCISTSKNISDIVHYAPPWNYNPSEGRGSKQPVTKEVTMEELLEVVK